MPSANRLSRDKREPARGSPAVPQYLHGGGAVSSLQFSNTRAQGTHGRGGSGRRTSPAGGHAGHPKPSASDGERHSRNNDSDEELDRQMRRSERRHRLVRRGDRAGGVGREQDLRVDDWRPGRCAGEVSAAVNCPTIGIGAGGACDGQVLVLHDMLGITQEFSPRFLRRYLDMGEQMKRAIGNYVQDVRSRDFPNEEEQY